MPYVVCAMLSSAAPIPIAVAIARSNRASHVLICYVLEMIEACGIAENFALNQFEYAFGSSDLLLNRKDCMESVMNDLFVRRGRWLCSRH